MNFTINRNPGIWCLAVFLVVFSLTFFGMAIPTIILGILALLSGILLLATG
jgi:hypothetical protein